MDPAEDDILDLQPNPLIQASAVFAARTVAETTTRGQESEAQLRRDKLHQSMLAPPLSADNELDRPMTQLFAPKTQPLDGLDGFGAHHEYGDLFDPPPGEEQIGIKHDTNEPAIGEEPGEPLKQFDICSERKRQVDFSVLITLTCSHEAESCRECVQTWVKAQLEQGISAVGCPHGRMQCCIRGRGYA